MPSSAAARASAGGQRSPADLDEHAVDEVAHGLDHLEADRPAGVEAERVLRALDGEGDGAGGDGFAEPVHARVAGRVAGRRGHT